MSMDQFREDAGRWVEVLSGHPPERLSPGVIAALLYKHPGLRAILWFRLGSWLKQNKLRMGGLVQGHIFSRFGLEIAVGSDIQGGLYIPHPSGTQVFARQIGTNCSIIANVTIGMRTERSFPVIGDGVYVGAGARVLGGITVGDYAVIGANAVVIQDVPAGATVVGVPARVIRMHGEKVDVPVN